MTVADRIDAVLQSRGMSRRQLAIAAGLPTSSLQAALARGRSMTVEMLLSVAQALDVSTDFLLGITIGTPESIANCGDAMKSLLSLINAGVLNYKGGVTESRPYICYGVTSREYIAFLEEYTQMMALYCDGNITENVYKTWLDAELAKLQTVPLTHFFIGPDGEWVSTEGTDQDNGAL